MNDQKLENKISRDAGKVKKDQGTLVGDLVARLGRVDDNVSQAAEKTRQDVTTFMDDSVDQVSEGFEKITGNAKESVVDAVSTARKDVAQGLGMYNTKVQQVANKIPGDFGKNAARNPWVLMTVALGTGILLGSLFKPTCQSLD
jgi:ElaB/YqjD/DUF883 family membrane-anchored ribosome-binding protein